MGMKPWKIVTFKEQVGGENEDWPERFMKSKREKVSRRMRSINGGVNKCDFVCTC